MPIPDYQTLMLPILCLAADGKEHSISDAVEELGKEFKLSEEERRDLLPSGTQARFDNRVNWARSYLKQAGLLVTPGRGMFRISESGRKVLANPPPKIDIRFLNQFVPFREFQGRKSKPAEPVSGAEFTPESDAKTPREALEGAYERLRKDLAAEILVTVKKLSPDKFERLVVELLVRMGYGGSLRDAGQAIGGSGDEGIDGTIKEDRLGLDVIYIQAKKWEGSVGRPEIQKFAGALQGQRAKKGVFMTTSDFSREARDFAQKIESRIALIDGDQLAQLMIDHNLGVVPVVNYEVKRIDSDYFDGE